MFDGSPSPPVETPDRSMGIRKPAKFTQGIDSADVTAPATEEDRDAVVIC